MSGKTKIGFAGGGKMAEAIIAGIRRGGSMDVLVHDPSSVRLQHLRKTYRATPVESNRALAEQAGVLVLAVKPADVAAVCEEIRDAVRKKPVISIAAGISAAFLGERLGSARIVRTMPNTPAFAGKGITVVASPPASKRDLAVAREIFSHTGEVLALDEKYLDAVTAVSGSGPAYVSLFIEALVDGAVRMGIARDSALRLVYKTVEGSLAMLEGGMHTSVLREMVTSPGGTTAEGLSVLERAGFKGLLMEALKTSARRASRLARKKGQNA